jgi:hypothetical protein
MVFEAGEGAGGVGEVAGLLKVQVELQQVLVKWLAVPGADRVSAGVGEEAGLFRGLVELLQVPVKWLGLF